jgi:hypothetical protein
VSYYSTLQLGGKFEQLGDNYKVQLSDIYKVQKGYMLELWENVQLGDITKNIFGGNKPPLSSASPVDTGEKTSSLHTPMSPPRKWSPTVW